MRKATPLYYDDKIDKDLFEFLDKEKGSLTRNAFIMTILYNFQKGNLIREFVKETVVNKKET